MKANSKIAVKQIVYWIIVCLLSLQKCLSLSISAFSMVNFSDMHKHIFVLICLIAVFLLYLTFSSQTHSTFTRICASKAWKYIIIHFTALAHVQLVSLHAALILAYACKVYVARVSVSI